MGVYIKGVTVEELMKVLICSTEFMPDGFEIVQTHDVPDINVGDMVSRSYLLSEYDRQHQGPPGGARKIIEEAPSAEQWIPFTSHEPDAKEKEMYSDYEYVLDGPLPEDGQRILVTIACAGHERVQEDEFYSDDGCYLDSGYDLISEAIAWMPLPKPYRKEDEQ